jgi:hypothetical protein
MKHLKLIALFFISYMLITGCSKEAEEAADSSGYSPSDINGTWKESKTGLTVRISGVSSSAMGTGIITDVGTAMPVGATGGACLKEVEYIRGGYWEAYNYTYYTNGTWGQTSVAGLAMTSKSQFKIGTAVYTRQ